VQISSSVEDYLKNIYKLQEKANVAKTKDLAQKMQVSLGTITNTVKMLEKRGLAEHVPYKGVKLTDQGNRIALDVIRRHRLVERLLTDILNMDWSKVHEVACRFEHDLTEDVIKPLRRALGYPKTCPHGNPIPTKHGGLTEKNASPLINLRQNERGTIIKIVEEDNDLLKDLQLLDLRPGTLVKVEKKLQLYGKEFVKLKEIDQPVSSKLASAIWVKKH